MLLNTAHPLATLPSLPTQESRVEKATDYARSTVAVKRFREAVYRLLVTVCTIVYRRPNDFISDHLPVLWEI